MAAQLFHERQPPCDLHCKRAISLKTLLQTLILCPPRLFLFLLLLSWADPANLSRGGNTARSVLANERARKRVSLCVKTDWTVTTTATDKLGVSFSVVCVRTDMYAALYDSSICLRTKSEERRGHGAGGKGGVAARLVRHGAVRGRPRVFLVRAPRRPCR